MTPFSEAKVAWLESSECDFSVDRCAGVVGPLEGSELANVKQAVVDSMEHPFEFPAARHAIVPGDRVVLPLSPSTVPMFEVVVAVVAYLVDCGIEPAGIVILFPAAVDDATVDHFMRRLADEGLQQVAGKSHDPTDESASSFLTATSDGEPVVCNREITEADVVLPVLAVSGPQDRLGYESLYTLYAAHDQIAGKSARGKNQLQQATRLEVLKEEFPLLIGAFFGVFVVPGYGGGVRSVEVGKFTETRARAIALAESEWVVDPPHGIDLVVANLPDFATYSWQGFRNAVEQSCRIVDGGRIVLRIPNDPESLEILNRLSNGVTSESAWEPIRESVERAGESNRLFLMSTLDEDLVEQLGMGHVGGVKELSRLANAHESWLLINDAGRCLVDSRFVSHQLD